MMRTQTLLVRTIVACMFCVLVGNVATEATPASAAPIPWWYGNSAETAASSCWEIKQVNPRATSGQYWLQTPTLVQPQRFYCDMVTDGGGWVLVGRGREGWSFAYKGQGSASSVRSQPSGPGAFSPAALGTKTIDGLLDGSRVDALPDGIRVRRAANNSGTAWQEQRWMPANLAGWSWAFGGGIPLASVRIDEIIRSNATSTREFDLGGPMLTNWTYPSEWDSGWKAGFGSGVMDAFGEALYWWPNIGGSPQFPFAQVFLRPKPKSTTYTVIPEAGLPSEELAPLLESRTSPATPWGVTGLASGTLVQDLDAQVLAMVQLGDTMYVGGKFTQVQQGASGSPQQQSYLAAFDVDTGEWRSSFLPTLDAPVWDLAVTPEGRLVAAGEFTTVNGSAQKALVALDPTTGATDTSWPVTLASGFADPLVAVRALDVQGNWLYVGGQFTAVTGGVPAFGPVTVTRLVRLRTSDARPDGAWKPSITANPVKIDASVAGDRVYVVGFFDEVNGASQHSLAVLDTATGALVPGLAPWVPTSETDHQQAILEHGDYVYQGGSEHMLHQYRRSDYAFFEGHITLRGGDFQALAIVGDTLYAACHCNNWNFSGTITYDWPFNAARVDPISYIGAYDLETFELKAEFQPQIKASGLAGEGPWELVVDTNDCLWFGGDMVEGSYQSTGYQWLGGFGKVCPRDTTAPTQPASFSASLQGGDDAVLTWAASTDDRPGTLTYEVLRGDRVIGTTTSNGFTDTDIVGANAYWVRAIDATGNRSATTSRQVVARPVSLVAAGASWSYLADGSDQGSAWRLPGFDMSAWVQGNAQLGWGDGDEATTVPNNGITSYYGRTFDAGDTSAYETLTLRLKRDDGAVVYLNGVEVLRSNVPNGTITATTPASSYVSGAAENTFYETTLPATLVANGTNTIAVELHQASNANGDATFDLELAANPPLSETTAPSTGSSKLLDGVAAMVGGAHDAGAAADRR